MINSFNCFRHLLPCQLVLDREVELGKGVATYRATNNVHRSSCTENYYQTGARETTANMELELFGQVIKERCFTQLRTKEQLGYVVKSLVRRSNGAQGIKIVVQSERGPEYLDARIEAFVASLEESIEQMEESEFNSHVEALASKRLEKPKQLAARNTRFWSEIHGQHYNFNRDEVEVTVLRSLTKVDLLNFYRTFVKKSPTRRKLSSQLLSTCNEEVQQNKSKHCKSPDGVEQNCETPEEDNCLVSNIVAFKSSLPLLPLATPYAPVQNFKR